MKKWTSEEVRALSGGIRRIAGGALSDYDGVKADERALNKAADMLLGLANRIGADERAVPWGSMDEWMPHPPAQAAQVGGLVTHNPAPHAAAPSVPSPTVTLHVGATTQPRSPDAADSGRVGNEVLWQDIDRMIVDAWKLGGCEKTLDMLVMRKRYDAALAAQGQGEAVNITDADLAAMRSAAMEIRHNKEEWFPMTERRLKRSALALLARHTCPPKPASPAGVPDGCIPIHRTLLDKLATDMDAINMPKIATAIRRWVANFDARIVAAPSATPEGGEVGL